MSRTARLTRIKPEERRGIGEDGTRVLEIYFRCVRSRRGSTGALHAHLAAGARSPNSGIYLDNAKIVFNVGSANYTAAFSAWEACAAPAERYSGDGNSTRGQVPPGDRFRDSFCIAE